MTHIVRSGETLSGIARANGITLAQLLDANPQFRANPNLIRVGDVLNIPKGQATPPVQPPRVQPPQLQPVAGRFLGRLSERFEVGNRGPSMVSGGGGDLLCCDNLGCHSRAAG
jgi:LysM repeat protein